MFVVASPVDADAPLASARDAPAIPNTGKALVPLLFEEPFDMAQFSRPFGHIGPINRSYEHWMLRPAEMAGKYQRSETRLVGNCSRTATKSVL
jgi:hypothetical protein